MNEIQQLLASYNELEEEMIRFSYVSEGSDGKHHDAGVCA